MFPRYDFSRSKKIPRARVADTDLRVNCLFIGLFYGLLTKRAWIWPPH